MVIELFQIDTKNNFKIIIKKFIRSKGPSLLVKIANGSLKNLIRPKILLRLKKNLCKLMNDFNFSSTKEFKSFLNNEKIRKYWLFAEDNHTKFQVQAN